MISPVYVIMLAAIFVLCLFAPAGAYDLQSDTWVATDAIGRTLPGYAECGPPRSGKYVGIFYFLPLGQHGTALYDITQIIAQNPVNPVFGPFYAPHFWGQPELGYYFTQDPYVLRKHAYMLAQAGVDVLIFDISNNYPYTSNYLALCNVFTQIRAQGQTTPQIVFLCPFGDPNSMVQSVYNNLYSKGLYPDLWFYWKGKPLILADPSFITNPAMRNFFTFRKVQPDGFAGPGGPNWWGWLEVSPQHAFYDDTGHTEQVTVGVAQNAYGTSLSQMSDKRGAMGRSWFNGSKLNEPGAINIGYNFSQQWDRAFQLDPAFIFITGWNEWAAGRFKETDIMSNPSYYPDAVFWDEYDQEYSRDVEPMKGGHTDNYYYQMAANIRKFKGVSQPIPPSAARTIIIDGSFSDWDGAAPEYRDSIGDVQHRNSAGFGGITYVNNTGRNDIVISKAAYDNDNVYFYAETAGNITPCTDPNWMLLFIDADCDGASGWQGYDYMINCPPISSTMTTLKMSAGGWNWTHVGEIAYRVTANKMEMAIPRSYIGKGGISNNIALDFHWADNIQKINDINEFFISGDSAPDRRFNYRYATAKPGPSWEFTRNLDTESWYTANGVANLNASDGYMVGDVSGPDPYITGPRYPDIDATANHYIWIRMKINVSGLAEFFWGTQARPYHEAYRELAFSVTGDNQFHDYIIDMSVNPQWSGLVNTLRFDPTTLSSGHFEVDFIRVIMAPPQWLLSDSTAPIGSMVINSGADHTISASVMLTVFATDTGSGVNQMRLSNDNASWSAWEPYASSRSWTLTSGYGTNTVYVQLKDAAGNISSTYLDDIEFLHCSIADLNNDCLVDMEDLGIFAGYWLHCDCFLDNWCGRTDLNYSTSTDFKDFAMMMDALAGNDVNSIAPNTSIMFYAGYDTSLNAQSLPPNGTVIPIKNEAGSNTIRVTTGTQGYYGGEALLAPDAQDALIYLLDSTYPNTTWMPAHGRLRMKFKVTTTMANASIHMFGFNYNTSDWAYARVSMFLTAVSPYGTYATIQGVNLFYGGNSNFNSTWIPGNPLGTAGWHDLVVEWNRPTPGANQENNVHVTVSIDGQLTIDQQNMCFGWPAAMEALRLGAYFNTNANSIGSYGGLIDRVMIERIP